MSCAEIQDRLWDGDPAACAHANACSACACAADEIARIRESLGGRRTPGDLAPGVIARMTRPARSGWGGLARAAAALLIGLLAGLALRPPPVVRTEVRLVHNEPRPLDRVLTRFDQDPEFEQILIQVLNETLRRRATEPLAKNEVNR